MTEKNLKKQYWINTLETGHIYINDGENHMSWQGVVDKLNALHEENEQLKFDKTMLHNAMSRDRVKYNQFKDKVFCQIDCKIKQLKNCYMVNEAKMIEDLREELIGNDRKTIY